MAKRGRKPRYTEAQSVEIAKKKEELGTDEWLAWVKDAYGECSDATIRKYAKKGEELLRKLKLGVIDPPEDAEAQVVAPPENADDPDEENEPEEVAIFPPVPEDAECQDADADAELTEHQKRCAAVAYAIQSEGMSISNTSEVFHVGSDFRTLDMQATGNALLGGPRGAKALEEAKALYDDVAGVSYDDDTPDDDEVFDPGDEPF